MMKDTIGKPSTVDKLEAMNKAARLAHRVLQDMEKDARLYLGVRAVRQWWAQNYRQARHKRLALALLGLSMGRDLDGQDG